MCGLGQSAPREPGGTAIATARRLPVTGRGRDRSADVLARLSCCLVLVLVPTAAACGDDERASAPGDPDQPVSGSANAGGVDQTGVKPASERT